MKRKSADILVLPFNEISLGSELSSPPCCGIQGGRYHECAGERRRTEILLSNIRFKSRIYHYDVHKLTPK